MKILKQKLQKNYDVVFLTNTPSFYKLNLCKEIAKYKSLLIVLYGYSNDAVNVELETKNWNFDFEFINSGETNKRNKINTFISLLALLNKIKVKKILFSGWSSQEYNLYSFLSPKRKNILICESSIIDVDMSGIKGWVKKRIINRMSAVLPSGKLHAELFKSIGFKGVCNITGSVGIFNKPKRSVKQKHQPIRYLYVGRLVHVKNVALLIDAFNANGKELTIVGDGPLREELEKRSNKNIKFLGFVDNNKLGNVYQNADVFILPSYSETWGLVVEEAIYWGLPVIVSNRVGSHIDIVQDLGTGVIFKSQNLDNLNNKINQMELHYDKYKDAVDKVDFVKRDRNQIEAYLKLL